MSASATRVLAVASHPIQYQAPWFRRLAAAPQIEFSVLFAQRPTAKAQGQGFGIAFEWDVPLLDGYAWRVAHDVSGPGGLGRFFAVRLRDPVGLLRELQPDVIVLTGWHAWPLVQLLFAAQSLRIPVVMRGEANALRRRPAWKRRVHRWLLARCAACLPIGRASREFYRTNGIGDERLFDAPYFVDNERFAGAAAAVDRGNARHRWGIPADAACFCFAGKFEPKKRLPDLLAAAKLARDHGATIHLLVVGSGEEERAAKQFVHDHALPVSFAGFLNQSEIAAAYAACDALVLPSDFGETWGLVVNEAMACGRAAIVSDRVGCGPDLVLPGETGEVFPFGDVAALAAAIETLAVDRAKLAALGRNAQARVMQHYNVERAAQGTLAAVRYVTGAA